MHRGVEVNRFLGVFFTLFFCISGVYGATSYSDTEQRYYFGPNAIQAALGRFVEKEDTRVACAELYTSLMNPENGEVSVTDLFAVCRKAGFNTYRKEGFDKCREFVTALLTEDDDIDQVMAGFCPGLDENGNNPNKLASITDRTRVGDLCTSSHIAMGEVVFKRDNSYSCTCMALVCNENYDLRGGACNTPIPAGTPICPNTKHPETADNNTMAKCLEFCTAKANRENCALSGVVMRHSTNECICSANADEIEAARQSMQRAANRNRGTNLNYYSVCLNDKRKSGGTERCVEGVFNWVNVGQLQAVGIAEEYARVHYGDTIKCKNGFVQHLNDDYIQCTSTKPNSKVYYEFQFDDVTESVDNDILADTVHSICSIHGLKDNVPHNLQKMATNALFGLGPALIRGVTQPNYYGCETTPNICSSKLNVSARKFGYTTQYSSSSGLCLIMERRLDRETVDDNLARIAGVDPYVFFHGIQIQGGQSIVDKLRKVVSDAGHRVDSFRCENSTAKIEQTKGIIGFATTSRDDVLRCYLNGSTPIDFVFEDFSESWLYKREEGESAIQCIISGGKFAGSKCHGLDMQACIDAGRRLQEEFPGTSGTRWDGTNCMLVDAQEAKTYDVGVNIGLGLVGAVDCAAGTHAVGCALFVVEVTGMATELAAGEMINARVDEFLSVGTRCKSRSCALSAIRDLGGKVMTVHDALGDAEMHAVDQTLAELIEYLEPEDLGALTGTEDWAQIIEQLGGNPDDVAGNVMVFMQYAGMIAQFASVGASGLRVTGRAIAKVAGKESRLGRAGSTMARFLEGSKKTADAAGDVARGARTTSNAADAAEDAARAANVTEDSSRAVARSASNSADSVDDAARGARTVSNTADAAEDAARAANVTEDSSRAVAHSASNSADSVDDVARGARTVSNTADAAETENVVMLKTNQALQVEGRERIAIVSEIEDEIPTRYGAIKMDWEDEEFVLEAIIKKLNGQLTHSEHLEAVKRLDKYFDENAARRYAMEMRQHLIDMPEDTIAEMLDHAEAGNGLDAAQVLVDYLAPKYGVEGKIQVVAGRSNGLAQYSTLADGRKVILYNSSLGSLEPEVFINLLTHEFSHAVDDLVPHKGVIGLKLDAYGGIGGLYPDSVNDIYALIPTERSSHIVGDIVSGRTNYGRGPSTYGLPTLYEEWIKRLED